ncbi:ABC transporter substrate-binding protein [Halalkaliarchaeum sp. AArc-GB]|uniref:ABC transporter substrate-binding protein n=1 Tax=unclassified Halalkaliarchaeum TaxID=2678344 RepID=UPI00217DFEE8|nr:MULTISPECIES: ABC transporter substrate-binding protein [unclassified Halalkaliarchaeum]MDR5674132.1 ABC transporter substrate-binding protein [Halalkaliarchaeum sp. AArc-GB]
MAERTVQVPAEVDRIVAVGPGALRLVCHLGVGSDVVAVEHQERATDNWTPPYNIAYPEFRELPTAGPQHGGDAEAIVTQAPDLIVASTDTPDGSAQLQSQTGVPTVWVDQGNFGDDRESLYTAWRTVAEAVGRTERAEELVSFVESRRQELQELSSDAVGHPSTFVGAVSHRGGQAMTSTEVPFPPFSMVGAESVAIELAPKAAESTGSTAKRDVASEKLLEWDPEVVFINRANLSIVQDGLRGSGLDSLSAVRNGAVYGVHPHYYYDYNPSTMLANAYYIGTILYPAAFGDVDPKTAADRVYRGFFDQDLYERMADAHGPYGAVEL